MTAKHEEHAAKMRARAARNKLAVIVPGTPEVKTKRKRRRVPGGRQEWMHAGFYGLLLRSAGYDAAEALDLVAERYPEAVLRLRHRQRKTKGRVLAWPK